MCGIPWKEKMLRSIATWFRKDAHNISSIQCLHDRHIRIRSCGELTRAWQRHAAMLLTYHHARGRKNACSTPKYRRYRNGTRLGLENHLRIYNTYVVSYWLLQLWWAWTFFRKSLLAPHITRARIVISRWMWFQSREKRQGSRLLLYGRKCPIIVETWLFIRTSEKNTS